MDEKQGFQSLFFDYHLPVPQLSFYSKQFAKSNDLRLLLEISTRSLLRMYTDPKTNNLHFICKQRGAVCFNIQAYLHQDSNYYFKESLQELHHAGNCEQKGVLFRYLQIYNLMKLKKYQIQLFMKKNDLMKESPSLILSKLSKDGETYFFQKFINGQLQLKRKLRKRFDNVINIDIKKIGKSDQKEEDELDAQTKIVHIKSQKEKYKTDNKIVKVQQNNQQSQIQECQVQPKNQVKKKKYIYKTAKKRLKSFKRLKKAKKIKQKITKGIIQEDMRQYIMILGNDNQQNKETIMFNSQPIASLPQLMVLDEHAEFLWESSSEQQQSSNLIKQQQKQPFQLLGANKEDYFKSLRNSTLKKSLQRESLTPLIFSKQNFI